MLEATKNVSRQVYRSCALGLYSLSDGGLSTCHVNHTELAGIDITFDPNSSSLIVVHVLPNGSEPEGHQLVGFTWNSSSQSVGDPIPLLWSEHQYVFCG